MMGVQAAAANYFTISASTATFLPIIYCAGLTGISTSKVSVTL
jgi:hypothetical protein